MNSSTFIFEGNVISFSTFGTGKKIFLAFHGFGQHKDVFRNLSKPLGNDCKIISIDLFMHGESIWAEKKIKLTRMVWKKIVSGFLDFYDIDTFSLLGFSMGGKFALATLEDFPEKIEKVILIAPDGIKTNFWYNLATLPGWTTNLFKNVIINPKRFQRLTQIFRKLKIVDQGLVRFAEGQLKTREQRLRVYYSWTIFSDFKFEMGLIAGLINQYDIDLTIFLGKYDKVITEKNINLLTNKIKNSKLIVLETGHNFLIESVGKWLIKNENKVKF